MRVHCNFDCEKHDIHLWAAFYWFLNINSWGRSVCEGVHFSQGVVSSRKDFLNEENRWNVKIFHSWKPLLTLFSRNIIYLFMSQFTVRWAQKETVWKNAKFSLTENFFCQINYSAISLVKPLLPRNFCKKKSEREFLQFPPHSSRTFLAKISWKYIPHTLEITEIHSYYFWQKLSWK